MILFSSVNQTHERKFVLFTAQLALWLEALIIGLF